MECRIKLLIQINSYANTVKTQNLIMHREFEKTG